MKLQHQLSNRKPRIAQCKIPVGAVARAAGIAASLAASIAASFALLGAAPAWAQAGKSVELRFATISPPKAVWTNQHERVTKAAEEESGGSVKISVFPAGQLGNEVDTLQQVARGRIDMGSFSAFGAALMVPELEVLLTPFYFKDNREGDCVVDSLTPVVRELWAAKGLHFLGWGHTGEPVGAAKRPLLTPADVKGQKVGLAGSKASVNFFAALGANSTALGATETAPAFQTGLIDWTFLPTTFYVAAGIGKVAPVMLRSENTDVPSMTLMNKATYDQLNPSQQQALSRAWARFPTAQLRKEVRDFEQMMRGAHEKGGGQIVQYTPEQREVWRKTATALWPKWIEDSGPGAPKLAEQVEAARKACAKQG